MLHLRPDGDHAERGVAPPVLRDFGDERTDHIEPEVWDECVRMTELCELGVIRLAEELRRHPENNNAHLEKLGYPKRFRVYRNNAWTVVDNTTFMRTRLGVVVDALRRRFCERPDMVARDMERGNPIARRITKLSARPCKEAAQAVYVSFVNTYERRRPGA